MPNPSTEEQRPDLCSETPVRLLARSIQEYGKILRNFLPTDSDYLEKVDYALRHIVQRALVRSAEESELDSIYSDLRALVPIDLEDEIPHWAIRWRAYADLIDARISVMAQGSSPEVRFLPEIAETILSLIRSSPGSTVRSLAHASGITFSATSRLVGILEGHDLVEPKTFGDTRAFYVVRDTKHG